VSEPTTPSAGWYPDPAGGGGLRWWTGVTWTDALRASPRAAATPSSRLPDEVSPAPPAVEPGPSAPVVDVPPDDTTAEGPDGRDGSDTSERRRSAARLVVVGAADLLVGIAAGVVVLPGSLSSRSKLDAKALENDIAARIAARTGLVATVHCPHSVDIDADASLTCTVTTVERARREVVLHQVDGQGNLTISGIPR